MFVMHDSMKLTTFDSSLFAHVELQLNGLAWLPHHGRGQAPSNYNGMVKQVHRGGS